MIGKWFSKKEKEDSDPQYGSPLWGSQVREPERGRPNRDPGRPPAGSDRDFVYDER